MFTCIYIWVHLHFESNLNACASVCTYMILWHLAIHILFNGAEVQYASRVVQCMADAGNPIL